MFKMAPVERRKGVFSSARSGQGIGGGGGEREAMFKMARLWLGNPFRRATVARGTEVAETAISPVAESDVIVIGGGYVGCAAAIKAARLGMKTTCIEMRGALGRTLPLKAVLHLCEDESALKLDLRTRIAKRMEAGACLTKGIEVLFRKNKVNYIKGTGRLAPRSQVFVDTHEGERILLQGKRIVIATGSRFETAFQGNIMIDEKKILSSSGALSLTEIPKSTVVIGASYLGLEFASVWGQLGSEVTVLDLAPNIFPTMDGQIRKEFQSILVNHKLKFMLETRVVGVDATSSTGVKLTIEPAAGGQRRTIEADVVVVPERRVPNTDGLGLENIDMCNNHVRLSGGISVVNRQMSTHVPGVYAMGDVVAPRPMLAARRAADNGVTYMHRIVTGWGEEEIDPEKVAGVIYTEPEVASIGMTEEQVRANCDVEHRVFTKKMEHGGTVRILYEKEGQRVLGVHIMSSNAEVMIGDAALALQHSDRDVRHLIGCLRERPEFRSRHFDPISTTCL